MGLETNKAEEKRRAWGGGGGEGSCLRGMGGEYVDHNWSRPGGSTREGLETPTSPK